MEPRSNERGNGIAERITQDGQHWASMEPRSNERGNLERRYLLAQGHAASMEPRSNERGNALIGGVICTQDTLQWSHAQTSVETSTCFSSLTEVEDASMEPRSNERGNDGGDQRSSGGGDASMEPRSNERGNVLREQPLRLDPGASMEPRSNERGNVSSIAFRR